MLSSSYFLVSRTALQPLADRYYHLCYRPMSGITDSMILPWMSVFYFLCSGTCVNSFSSVSADLRLSNTNSSISRCVPY